MKPMIGGKKRVLLALILLSIFIFFMFLVIYTYHIGLESTLPTIIEPLFRYHLYLMFMMGALGIAVGATVYYLMSQRVEHKSEVAKHNTTALIRFLNPDERNIIDRIIQGNGRALQSELTRELGLSKVKIHRVVDKLKKRGIIFMSKYGKTNSIVLNKDLLEALK